MTTRWMRKLLAASMVLSVLGGGLLTSCNVLVDVPGATVDVSRRGVYVDFPGGEVNVERDGVFVDFPGGHVSVGRHIEIDCD
ncbi:MAG: hypothetical protein ABII12_05340 [Planctomycetota bacterium]